VVRYSRQPLDSVVRAGSAVAYRVSLGVLCRWIRGQKLMENLNPCSLAGRVDIEARRTLVNILCVIAYLLLVMVQGKAIKGRDTASRAKELLQLITYLRSCELDAPCAGGTAVISTRGVSYFAGTQWRNSGVLDGIGVSDLQEIPERLMSMVLHTLEARLWSAAWNERAMPEMLPALLPPDSTQRAERSSTWKTCGAPQFLAESEQDTGCGSQAVRLQIYWIDWFDWGRLAPLA